MLGLNMQGNLLWKCVNGLTFSFPYQRSFCLPPSPDRALWRMGNYPPHQFSTSILEHEPKSSLRLNVFLYLYKISIGSYFSFWIKHDVSRFTYFCNISMSLRFCLPSSSISQEYWSVYAQLSSVYFSIRYILHIIPVMYDSKWYWIFEWFEYLSFSHIPSQSDLALCRGGISSLHFSSLG